LSHLVDAVRVFVVDDHAYFREAVAAIVEETEGFVVSGSAASAEEGLAALAVTRTDLVLMDVNLPGLDGIEATKVITRADDAPVVVLLSTYDEAELDYADCGAAAYLNKSAFGPDLLQETWAGTRR
jgi:DNA-binding NarL/FixJ family response regulator